VIVTRLTSGSACSAAPGVASTVAGLRGRSAPTVATSARRGPGGVRIAPSVSVVIFHLEASGDRTRPHRKAVLFTTVERMRRRPTACGPRMTPREASRGEEALCELWLDGAGASPSLLLPVLGVLAPADYRRRVDVGDVLRATFLQRNTVTLQEWQPIETAPKDGTDILLMRRGSYIRTGFWARRMENWSLDIAVRVDPPTHWAPLPKPL
jgi:hypothetical protein